MTEVIAETARLRLRTWVSADRDRYAQQCNTPAVHQWLGGLADSERLNAMSDWLYQSQARDGYSFWVIERSSDQAFLGLCGLQRVDDLPTLAGETEIGWRLREDAWGMGYAREAAEAVLHWGFAHTALSRIVAMTVPQNSASWGLMQRLGMVRAPTLDFDHPKVEEPIKRHIVYTMTRGDWTQ